MAPEFERMSPPTEYVTVEFSLTRQSVAVSYTHLDVYKRQDDDTATILIVDSNIQRENILPSERAQAYKMKLEAIRRKAGRPAKTAEIDGKNNSRQVVGNLESADIVGQEAGESGRQVQRYIRLTELTPELQQMVDEKKIGMTPAVEISYLKPEEQQMLLTAIDSEQATDVYKRQVRRGAGGDGWAVAHLRRAGGQRLRHRKLRLRAQSAQGHVL